MALESHLTESAGEQKKHDMMVTGVSVQHERETDNFAIRFLDNEKEVMHLVLPVHIVRMLKKALEPMKILDEDGQS